MNKKLLKKELNKFYSCLALEDKTYANCHIQLADLNNTECLNEILYDIDDNTYVYEGAAELHDKVEYLLHKERSIKTIGKFMIGIGMFTALVGIPGDYELANITFAQFMIRMAISVGVAGIGAIFYKKGDR